VVRRLSVEVLGTGLLVYLAVGVATLSFGFGASGLSFAAGVVATTLAFGLVLLVLAYVIDPVSGCHIKHVADRARHRRLGRGQPHSHQRGVARSWSRWC
jgi:major intrinsic protein